MFDGHQFTSLRTWKIPIKWSKNQLIVKYFYLSFTIEFEGRQNLRLSDNYSWKNQQWIMKKSEDKRLLAYTVNQSLQSVHFYVPILAQRKQLIRRLWATIQCKYIKILTSSLSTNNNISSREVKLTRNPKCGRCCRWVIRRYWVTLDAALLHEMQVQCLTRMFGIHHCCFFFQIFASNWMEILYNWSYFGLNLDGHKLPIILIFVNTDGLWLLI